MLIALLHVDTCTCILDWILFAAAASTDNNLRSSLIDLVHSYAFSPSNSTPFTPLYDPTTGRSLGGSNRLVAFALGAHFPDLIAPNSQPIIGCILLRARLRVCIHIISSVLRILISVSSSKPLRMKISGVGSQPLQTKHSRKTAPLIIGGAVSGGLVFIAITSCGVWIHRKRLILQRRAAVTQSWTESHSRNTAISSNSPPTLQTRSTTLLKLSKAAISTIRPTRREATQSIGATRPRSITEIGISDAPPPYIE